MTKDLYAWVYVFKGKKVMARQNHYQRMFRDILFFSFFHVPLNNRHFYCMPQHVLRKSRAKLQDTNFSVHLQSSSSYNGHCGHVSILPQENPIFFLHSIWFHCMICHRYKDPPPSCEVQILNTKLDPYKLLALWPSKWSIDERKWTHKKGNMNVKAGI